MNLFNKLPGFVPTPPGRERRILRLLPRVLLYGTLLLAVLPLLLRIVIPEGSEAEAAARIALVDIYVISLVVLHWTVVLTVAIAAFIVLVMKGPAYVADAYPLADSDTPAVMPLSASRDK
jgi:hypothetical protein